MSENSEKIELVVPEDFPATRLDKAIAELYPDLSRSRIKALILSEDVVVSGYCIKQVSHKVGAGDSITVTIPEAVDDTPRAENIHLDIIYEDDDLIVINKPVGLVVHPGAGNPDGTLVNALLYHCKDNLSGIGGVKRPGIVHRLDKETSGLMIVAKNDLAHQGLSNQLQDRSLSRVYTAFSWRVPTLIKGVVDQPIGRHNTNRLKMAIRTTIGREARTAYKVIEKHNDVISEIECRLDTGRTHQIRVHLQHIKHPLIGDPLYGLAAQEARAILKRGGYEDDVAEQIITFPRQALHAHEISFIHPRSEEKMTFKADFPEDMLNLKKLIKS